MSFDKDKYWERRKAGKRGQGDHPKRPDREFLVVGAHTPDQWDKLNEDKAKHYGGGTRQERRAVEAAAIRQNRQKVGRPNLGGVANG